VTISQKATPAPIALADLTPPSVSGTPKYGHTLSCDPGTWTGAPTFSYTWTWQVSQRLAPFRLKAKGRNFGVKRATLRTSTYFAHQSVFAWTGATPVGAASTLDVPDVPTGSSFSCGVKATLAPQTVGSQSVAAQNLSAVTGFISSQPSAPFLITQQRLHNGRIRTLPAPHITPNIAVGDSNTCLPGVWAGSPYLTFAWYAQGPVPKKRTIKRTMTILHDGQTYTVDYRAEEKDLVCVVTAANPAGQASAFTNDYVVPIDPPRALTYPFVTINTEEPASSPGMVGPEGANVVAEQIELTCAPVQWNRPLVSDQVGWYTVASQDPFTGAVQWQPFASGATLDLDMRPGNLQLSANLYCLVTGTTSHGASATVYSGEIGVWNGCTEVATSVAGETPDTDSILDNAAAVVIDGASGGAVLVATAGTVDYAAGLYDALEGLDFLGSPSDSTEIYTYGPNCGDYQQYWMGQGYTVKQQPGDGP
jgi:hypothetical protein